MHHRACGSEIDLLRDEMHLPYLAFVIFLKSSAPLPSTSRLVMRYSALAFAPLLLVHILRWIYGQGQSKDVARPLTNVGKTTRSDRSQFSKKTGKRCKVVGRPEAC